MGNNYQISQLESAELINHLKTAIEVANLGIWKWELRSDKIYFSPECFEILGITSDSFENTMKYLMDNILHKDSKHEFIKAIGLAKDYNLISNKEYRINNSNKKYCWVKVKSQVIYEDKLPLKIVGTLMDVTEEKKNKRKLEMELNFVKTLIEIIPNPVFYKNYEGLYKYFNMAFENFLGFSKEQILNKTVYDIAVKERADIYKKADDDLMNSKGKQIYETKLKHADGTLRDVIFNKAAHLNNKNETVGLVGIIQDITEQREIERELQKLYEIKEIFLELNHSIMKYTNEKEFLHEVMLKFSRVFEETDMSTLLEVSEDGMISLHDSHGFTIIDESAKMVFKDSFIYFLTQGNYNEVCILPSMKAEDLPANDPGKIIIEQNKIKSGMFIPIVTEGDIRWFFIYSSSKDKCYSEKIRSLTEYIRIEMHNIIQVFKLYQKTLTLSRFDGLTGLMNRRYFDENLKNLMGKKESEFAVVIVDLDKLKILNDELGHQDGDYYIKLIGNFLNLKFNKDSFWGRIGGDEFAGAILHIAKNELIGILEGIRKEYSNMLSKNTNGNFSFSFSYGISYCLESPNELHNLIKLADDRMYKYKMEHRK